QHDSRRRPGQAQRPRARRERRLLPHPGLEVGVRPPQPLRDRPRDRADLALERLVNRQLAPGRAREKLDRPVVVRRPEAAGDDAEVGAKPLAKRLLELLRPVADDRDARRLEPEPQRLARKERAVAVGALAADELAAGDDEGGPRPAGPAQAVARTRLKPWTVTTTARPSGNGRTLPFRGTWMLCGAPATTHIRFPHSETACLPGSSLPALRSLPLGELRSTLSR